MARLRCVLVCGVFLLAGSATGAIRHVPGTYATIQAAIDAAAAGDTVLVAPGHYPENINFHGHNVVVASNYLLTRDPADILATIIDGSQAADPDSASVVLFTSGEDSSAVLEGFTITGGTGTGWKDEHSSGTYREGGGILTAFTSPTIRHNYIVDNDASDDAGYTSAGGGGIRSGDGNPRIIGNVIASNRGRYGAGIVLNFCAATVRNNVIFRNSGGEDFGGSGIWVNGASSGIKLIENNTITDNEVFGNSGGGLWVQSASVTARNNIIWNNRATTEPQISVAGATFTLTASDVEGGWFGSGNLSADPLFSDSSHLLRPGSPCIDAGNASTALNDPEDSSAPGMARFPSRGTTRNDMGAYGGPWAARAPLYDAHINDPLPPAGISAASDYLTPSSVTLSWTDPLLRRNGMTLDGFKIQVYRDSLLVAEVDSGIGLYIDGGLTTHQEYRYRLRTVVVDDTSTFDSATAFAGGAAAPNPVTALTTRDGTSGVRVAWRNPSRQADGTPLNDLAFILLYRDGILFDSLSQSFADTGAFRSYDDTAQGYHSYQAAARDNEVPPHTSPLPTPATGYGGLAGVFRTSFEEGTGRALKTGSWDTTGAIASDSTHALTDSPGGNAPAGSTSAVTFPPVLLGPAPMLSFDQIAIVRSGGFALLDISTNQRQSFMTIRSYDWNAHPSWQDGSADSGDWVSELIDLGPYAGDTVTLRLRLITSGQQSADGWYVDHLYCGPSNLPDTAAAAEAGGWSLFSLPLHPPSPRLDAIFPDALAAYRFQGSYAEADSLRPGIGYWLRFDSARGGNIAGETIARDTIPLVRGWNLIGAISTPLDTGRTRTIPSGIRTSRFFGFDSHYAAAATLEPGHGYWVRASQAGKLVLSIFVPPGASPGKPAAAVEGVRISVTDARGRFQELTAGSGGPDADAPPLPPQGIFDVRYAGDRYHARASGPARFAIQVQAADYPLTITWNGAALRGWSITAGAVEEELLSARTLVVAAPCAVTLVHATDGTSPVPLAYHLDQNAPNPFNPTTVIRYGLMARSHVTVELFTSLGQSVVTLVDEEEDAGERSIVWDARGRSGRELSSGVYYCRLEARPLDAAGAGFSEVRRMVLLR